MKIKRHSKNNQPVFNCSISNLEIKKEDSFRVIFGFNNDISKPYHTGMTKIIASFPAIFGKNHEMVFNEKLMSQEEFLEYRLHLPYQISKGNYSLNNLIQEVNIQFYSNKSNIVFTIVLEDVFQLLCKELKCNNNESENIKTTDFIKMNKKLLCSVDYHKHLHKNEDFLNNARANFEREKADKKNNTTFFSKPEKTYHDSFDNADDYVNEIMNFKEIQKELSYKPILNNFKQLSCLPDIDLISFALFRMTRNNNDILRFIAEHTAFCYGLQFQEIKLQAATFADKDNKNKNKSDFLQELSKIAKKHENKNVVFNFDN